MYPHFPHGKNQNPFLCSKFFSIQSPTQLSPLAAPLPLPLSHAILALADLPMPWAHQVFSRLRPFALAALCLACCFFRYPQAHPLLSSLCSGDPHLPQPPFHPTQHSPSYLACFSPFNLPQSLPRFTVCLPVRKRALVFCSLRHPRA